MPTVIRLLSEMTENEAKEWGRKHISVPYWTRSEIWDEMWRWYCESKSPIRSAMLEGYWKSWVRKVHGII